MSETETLSEFKKEWLPKLAAIQARYDELPKQNLLVRFHMAMPFSSTDWLRLDGILSYFSLADALGDRFFGVSGTADPDPDPIDAPLPMERCANPDGVWWWACSFGVPSSDRETISRWKKRWDEENDDLVKFPEKRLPRIDHKAGYFKAYDMPLVLKCAREVIFCLKANAQEIERLLVGVRFVGKKGSQGYGEVARITVEETGSATGASWWCYDEAGRPTRAIPTYSGMEMPKTFHLRQCGYRAPYWHMARRAMCLVP